MRDNRTHDDLDSLVGILEAGARAYREGRSREANPGPHGTALYWNWLEGYDQAARPTEEDERVTK